MGELDAEVMHCQTYLTLPALRAHSRAHHASDDAGLRAPDVIPIEAGDGEGLKNVKFDAYAAERIGHLFTPERT